MLILRKQNTYVTGVNFLPTFIGLRGEELVDCRSARGGVRGSLRKRFLKIQEITRLYNMTYSISRASSSSSCKRNFLEVTLTFESESSPLSGSILFFRLFKILNFVLWYIIKN